MSRKPVSTASPLSPSDSCFSSEEDHPAWEGSFEVEEPLKRVFAHLQTQTGHDFSQYKRRLILGRIQRQMKLGRIELPEAYASFLEQSPEEMEALLHEILIKDTCFFRDQEAFETLGSVLIPKLLKSKAPGSSIRVWVPGCSSGEEAYSLAILLQEQMEELKLHFKVQLFATEIDREALEQARRGVYPFSISSQVSPERLERFFTLEPNGGGYVIKSEIRDLLIFSEQDLIKDAPLFKMDLVSCRNVLIYMSGELQRKLLPLLHYALNPDGYLFLGIAESVGEYVDLFSTVDRNAKLFQRRNGIRKEAYREAFDSIFSHLGSSRIAQRLSQRHPQGKSSLRELAERTFLARYSFSGALVNERGEILYLHGQTGEFLELNQGEPVLNLFKMVREGLRQDLTIAFQKAISRRQAVCHPGLRLRLHGHEIYLNLVVCPAVSESDEPAPQGLFLVIFEQIYPEKVRQPERGEAHGFGEVLPLEALKKEFQMKIDYLQSANAQLEAANEELRTINEEGQAMNEEFMSASEELETKNEELQSTKMELATIKSELELRVADLIRANEAKDHLLRGTEIGVVLVDCQERIESFTPACTQVINLIASDIGRPIGHLLTNLEGYERLVEDVQEVLKSLVSKEQLVKTKDQVWFLLTIRPYHPLNRIEGALISFVNVTGLNRNAAATNGSGAGGTLGNGQ